MTSITKLGVPRSLLATIPTAEMEEAVRAYFGAEGTVTSRNLVAWSEGINQALDISAKPELRYMFARSEDDGFTPPTASFADVVRAGLAALSA